MTRLSSARVRRGGRRWRGARRRGGRRCGGRGCVSSPLAASAARRSGSSRSRAQVARHLGAVAGDEEVLAGAEQALGVVPGRGDQRDAAGQRLEDADRRDAGQLLDVGAARHVDGGEVAGEDLGRARRWRASRGSGRRSGASSARARRRGSARRRCRAAGRRLAAGRDQEGLELRGALAVAPVADPDQAPRAGSASAGGWKSAVSAASCQTKTRSPQPQRR